MVTLPSIPRELVFVGGVPYDVGKTLLDSSGNMDGGLAVVLFGTSLVCLGVVWCYVMKVER